MMQVCTIEIAGEHVPLASKEDIASGIAAAQKVFVAHDADPEGCAVAHAKMERDELLTREEALLCVIWEEADEAAFRAVTLGWLVRGELDIRLVVK